MKLSLIVCLLMCGCLHDPYAAPANYVRDDLYCYHVNRDGHWEIQGLARQCPDNTAQMK